MRSILAAFALAAAAGTASATPLTLSYCVVDDGSGVYTYTFTLTLDNNDGSWSAGQGFNWIIWGDAPFPGPSPLEDFVNIGTPPPPFDDEGWSFSSGGHNGPTLLDFGVEFDFRGWIPTDIGESLTWSGTSATFLGEGELIWSNLVSYNGSIPADFVVATYDSSCGCPADFNGDGFVTGDDFDEYVVEFTAGNDEADFNGDGFVTGDDFDAFVVAFTAGC